MDGSGDSRCCQTGKQQHRRGGSSFYASFLQRILNRKLIAQLDQDQTADVTTVQPTTEELPTLKVQTLNSDQHGIVLPPIAQRGLPVSKPHHRDLIPPGKGRGRGCWPPPSQKVVHSVQVQVDCVGGSQGSGCSAWDNYDFTPVYIWVPKVQRQQSKTAVRQEPMGPRVKTTYLNEAIVLPGTARDKKKKKRRKPPTRSPSARWYGDLLSEYYSDLIDLTEEQLREILAGTHLRDIIGSRASHSRNEQVKNVSDSQKTGKTTAVIDGPSAAPGLQTEEEEDWQCKGDKALPKAPMSEGMATGAGPLQDRAANGHSKGEASLEEPSPPRESSQESRTEEGQTDVKVGVIQPWPRPLECISRYPYGNPSQPRIPRTQSVPLYPLSLQSAASYSTTETLRAARNASLQSTTMINVRTCELAPRSTSKEDCLPPLVKLSPRTPPPTASQPIRLSDTIL